VAVRAVAPLACNAGEGDHLGPARRYRLGVDPSASVQDAVRAGRVPPYAAMKDLVPLARANAEHARILLAQLEHQPLSTRELKRFYEQYRQATKVQRRRLVENPVLFLQALDSRKQAADDKRLAAGPEGAWYKDLRVVSAILERLLAQVPPLFGSTQEAAERERLQQAFGAAKTQFQRLELALSEVAGNDR